MESAVIETRGLTKMFGRVAAVRDLSLEVPRGGVFGLLGPNGSGKTTTMGMLLGLVQATSGSFYLFGQEGATPETLRRIGAIVETPAFYPYMSGRDNLRYFQGITGRGSPDEVDHLLETVELSAHAGRKFGTYSLGMKQRLGIASAMLGDPELMFLDEPTNGLDPAGMAEVRDFIRSLGQGGRTVILSSHLLNEVEQVCDRLAILARGRLITQGDVQELLSTSGSVRMRTTDNAKAAPVLSALPFVSDVQPSDGLLVVTAPPEQAWELSRALAEQEVYVQELTPVHVSLEQYFLEVTSEDEGAGNSEARQ
ncbi:MAG: ABC transporter ATP-binding protein [Chloroflexota bacterium]